MLMTLSFLVWLICALPASVLVGYCALGEIKGPD